MWYGAHIYTKSYTLFIQIHLILYFIWQHYLECAYVSTYQCRINAQETHLPKVGDSHYLTVLDM
jgi:hypothetical protein